MAHVHLIVVGPFHRLIPCDDIVGHIHPRRVERPSETRCVTP